MSEQEVIEVVGAAIIRGRHVLVARRGPGGAGAGRWEFPGGKVESGESDAEALRRELDEELGVTVVVGQHLGTGYAAPSAERTIELRIYACRLAGAGEPVAHEHQELRWIGSDTLDSLDWAEPDIPVLPAVADRLRSASGLE